MSPAAILGPNFALIALLLVLFGVLAMRRGRALGNREVDVPAVALDTKKWPPRAVQAADCVNNQFQMPILYHLLTGFAMATQKADLLFVVLGWVFVAARVVQAWIHVGHNELSHRGAAFGVGTFVLFAMWIIFAVRIVGA